MRIRLYGLAALALAGVATVASAHHSRGHFDYTRTVRMQATITRVVWANPHVYFVGDVRDGDGAPVEWTFEGHTIHGQMRVGWTRDTVKVGDAVTIIANPHRDATRRLVLVNDVVLPDGRRMPISEQGVPH